MKIVGFCMAFWLVEVILLQTFSGAVYGKTVVAGNKMAEQVTSKNMKENEYSSSFFEGSSSGNVNLEDYRPYDPSPSSKASVRPGPIVHGTPLMPYIPNPKPSPPHSFDQDQRP